MQIPRLGCFCAIFLQVLGPEHTAYLVAALNPPGVCARGLSGVLLKAVQSPTPVPLFVAQRSEEVIKGTFFPDLAMCINFESMRATLTVSESCRLAPWRLFSLCNRAEFQDDVCIALSCCDSITSCRGRKLVCQLQHVSAPTHTCTVMRKDMSLPAVMQNDMSYQL